jgi:hypothetical protein
MTFILVLEAHALHHPRNVAVRDRRAGRGHLRLHAIERYIYRHHQGTLVRELHHNIDAETYPFTETCRQIGLELSRLTDVIQKIGEASSPTFSGDVTKCALWRKLKPTV